MELVNCPRCGYDLDSSSAVLEPVDKQSLSAQLGGIAMTEPTLKDNQVDKHDSAIGALNQITINGEAVSIMAAPVPAPPIELMQRRSRERAQQKI